MFILELLLAAREIGDKAVLQCFPSRDGSRWQQREPSASRSLQSQGKGPTYHVFFSPLKDHGLLEDLHVVLRVGCPVIMINLYGKFKVRRHVEIHKSRDEGVMTSLNSYVVLRHLVHVGEMRWNVNELRSWDGLLSVQLIGGKSYFTD